MNYFKLLSVLVLLSLSTPAFAAGQTVTVGVNGMVCDFCAQALEKVFLKKEEVENIKINLDTKQVIVTLKDGQDIDDETLKSLIADSGYDVRDITRTDGPASSQNEGDKDGSAL